MTYKIKQGDTLTSIANEFNTTVDALVKENGIKNRNLIYAGHTLTIPGTKTVSENLDISGAYKAKNGGDSSEALSYVKEWKDRRPVQSSKNNSAEISKLLSELSKRRFDYNTKTDPVAAAYLDSYRDEARNAMSDAMGKAASLTGGLGNSYAQAAGNQAYASLMSKGVRIIPELYEAAYKRFSQDGDDIRAKIELLRELDDSEFERYNDALKTYLDEGDMLLDNYRYLSEDEFDAYLDYQKYLLSKNK